METQAGFEPAAYCFPSTVLPNCLLVGRIGKTWHACLKTP